MRGVLDFVRRSTRNYKCYAQPCYNPVKPIYETKHPLGGSYFPSALFRKSLEIRKGIWGYPFGNGQMLEI